MKKLKPEKTKKKVSGTTEWAASNVNIQSGDPNERAVLLWKIRPRVSSTAWRDGFPAPLCCERIRMGGFCGDDGMGPVRSPPNRVSKPTRDAKTAQRLLWGAGKPSITWPPMWHLPNLGNRSAIHCRTIQRGWITPPSFLASGGFYALRNEPTLPRLKKRSALITSRLHFL